MQEVRSTGARWMTWVAVALGIAGCVRAGFGVAGSSDAGPVDVGRDHRPDASSDRGSVADRSADQALPADPLAPFGAPKVVAELGSSLDEDDPTLTSDMLEIHFDRDGDVWRATRPSVSAAWETPQPVTEVNTAGVETSPEVSADGLTLFLATNRSHTLAKGAYDIFVSTRASRADPWSEPAPVAELNSAFEDFPGGTTSDLQAIIFPSKRPGGPGNDDLHVATRDSATSAWSVPNLVSELNSTLNDSSPWLSADGLVVYLDRGAAGGTDGRSIWVATRGAAGDPFSTPTILIGGIDSPQRDTDPWLSPDLHTIYFCSNRTGDQEIYVATR